MKRDIEKKAERVGKKCAPKLLSGSEEGIFLVEENCKNVTDRQKWYAGTIDEAISFFQKGAERVSWRLGEVYFKEKEIDESKLAKIPQYLRDQL